MPQPGTSEYQSHQRRVVDWPVGYLPGPRLADVWKFEEPHLGQKDFYYWQDATAHKNRMQGNDFTQSVMYHRGMRCFDCHDVHSAKNPSNLIATGNAVCLKCHTRDNPAGPHTGDRTHPSPRRQPGSQCVACHMPKIEQTTRRQLREQPYVPLHYATVVGTIRYSESLQYLSQGQIERMGGIAAQGLGDDFAVAGCALGAALLEIAPVGTDAAVRHHRHLQFNHVFHLVANQCLHLLDFIRWHIE